VTVLKAVATSGGAYSYSVVVIEIAIVVIEDSAVVVEAGQKQHQR